MKLLLQFLYLVLMGTAHPAAAQDSLPVVDKIVDFPGTFLDRMNKKAAGLEEKIIAKTEKALHRLEKQEQKLYKKLAKKDSVAAAQLFAASIQKYQRLREGLSNNEQNPSAPNNTYLI